MDKEMNNSFGNTLTVIAVRLEKEIIAKRVAEDVIWRSKYNELLSINEMLQKEELDVPSLRFTKKRSWKKLPSIM